MDGSTIASFVALLAALWAAWNGSRSRGRKACPQRVPVRVRRDEP
jgi:hypothetical protein